MGIWGLSPQVKLQMREDDHLLPSTAEVKNELMYNSTQQKL